MIYEPRINLERSQLNTNGMAGFIFPEWPSIEIYALTGDRYMVVNRFSNNDKPQVYTCDNFIDLAIFIARSHKRA